jgi:hypothetical protein
LRKISLAKQRRSKKYLPSEVLPHVVSDIGNRKRKVEFDGDLIKVTSDRLVTFKSSLVCATCGIEGEYFVKEKGWGQKVYHFNLYAVVDGEEVLMTKDHIVPRSKGGKNNPSNYQTMCRDCNAEKKDDIKNLLGESS